MKKLSSFILLFLINFAALAQDTFDPQSLLKAQTGTQHLVNDYTNTLTPEQKQALENKLVALDDSTSTQIAVIIVPTTGSADVADYATELGRAWGIGGKNFNNGVVLLIAKNDRKLNISPGYGLEGSLTDVTASSIIEDVIKPNFKGEDYYRGIDEGTDAIMSAVRGTYHTPRDRSSGKGGNGGIFIFIIIIVLIFFLSNKGGGKGGGFMSRRGYRGLGAAPFLFGTGGFGGGGGGGFGGGGGGGFGGFGGGGFGGGGASGSW